MRAVVSRALVPWQFLPVNDEAPLIHLKRVERAERFRGLARLPEGWLEIPRSRVHSAQQMFAGYARSGERPAHYYCSNLAVCEPSARAVARFTLGEWRVAVLPTADGYEARWQVGDTAHRLSGGPVELAAFMEFVLSLTPR